MASKLESSVAGLSVDGSDWAASAPKLARNLALLSPDQIDLAKMLIKTGQSHVFELWSEPGLEDDQKRTFFDQVARLNASYPGGLESYINNAKELLADSKAGKNPYDGFTPSVPKGENLTFGDDSFIKYEEAGVKEARNAAFVLVAGGLGERLGYNGIKVALPSESCTGTCFLQLYIESILALQEASNKLVEGECLKEIPFAIMTSDDTHSLTLALLESNAYFGMKSSQVTLGKQEKVACLQDNDARLALDPKNKYRIQTKPHGHGDVHSLLHSTGTLNLWHDAGVKYVLFFQDTTGFSSRRFQQLWGLAALINIKLIHLLFLAKQKKQLEASPSLLMQMEGQW